MRDDQELVAIAEYEAEFDAELARTTLEDAGIQAVVFGPDLTTMLPHINAIRIELRVFEDDVEKAKQILAEKHPLEDYDDEETEDEDNE